MPKLLNSHRVIKVIASALFVGACVTSPSKLLAQEEIDWWFDVEVIVFTRTGNDSQISEDFSKAMFDLDINQAVDLFSPALSKSFEPNSLYSQLPICQKPSLKNVLQLPSSSQFEALKSIDLLYPVEQLGNDELQSTLEANEVNQNRATISSEASQTDLLLKQIQQEGDADWLQKIPENINICAPFNFDEYESYLYQLGMLEYQYELRNITELIDSTPRRYNVEQTEFNHHHVILPDESLKLTDYASELYKQRNVKTLLHTSWRQPVVFGEENADYYRVFAGERFRYEKNQPSYEQLAAIFAEEEQSIETDTQDATVFFKNLRASLADPSVVDWVKLENLNESDINEDSVALEFKDTWELDGQIKVYLRYINRIPYLHLDNEFMLHALNMNAEGSVSLEHFPFKQRRRIISKQIHYFDHPKFGLIIRLERFEPPKESENEEQTQT